MLHETLRDHILRLTSAYGAATGLAETTILKRAANDARFLERTASGSRTFTVRVYENAVQWFADNWPDGTAWPEGIERPASPTAASAA